MWSTCTFWEHSSLTSCAVVDLHDLHMRILVLHETALDPCQTRLICDTDSAARASAGLTPSLMDPNASITVLVPTNQAFAELPPTSLNTTNIPALQLVCEPSVDADLHTACRRSTQTWLTLSVEKFGCTQDEASRSGLRASTAPCPVGKHEAAHQLEPCCEHIDVIDSQVLLKFCCGNRQTMHPGKPGCQRWPVVSAAARSAGAQQSSCATDSAALPACAQVLLFHILPGQLATASVSDQGGNPILPEARLPFSVCAKPAHSRAGSC